MTEQEFIELLARGHEQRGIEFKRAGSRRDDKHLLAKVIRATISMANRRDGGLVIVGIDEDDNGIPVPVGISDDDLATWSHDEFADSLAEYADPSVDFEVEIVDYSSKKFLVIHVQEFSDIPVLCKKAYSDVLRAGACYVRTRRKPETVEIPTQTDMRDLLDLAIEKGVRKFIAQARAAGLGSSDLLPPSDNELFNQQLGILLGK